MYLKSFHNLDKNKKFQSLLISLNRDFGIDASIYANLSKNELKEFIIDLEKTKRYIISESSFNSYYKNKDYVKTSLLIEAIRIILREISPKRLSKKRKNKQSKSVDETLNYKIHGATSVAVDHDLEDNRERPDLYWNKRQAEEEKSMENHPVNVSDGGKYGLEAEMVPAYAQNVDPDSSLVPEDDIDAGIYVAVMNPDRFLGDKEMQMISIEPMVKSENEKSLLTRKVSPVMVDVTNEGIEKMKYTIKNGKIVKGLGKLLEGELERAEIVLATKDLSARLQKMIEDLGKMGTDDIMPLVDGLRNNFGPDVAEDFSNKAEEKIQLSVNAIQNFKDAVDKESQRLENRISDEDVKKPFGDLSQEDEEEKISRTADELAGTENKLSNDEESLEDILNADEASASEEPLGRAKKEHKIITISGKKIKLSENQFNLLTQAAQLKRKINNLIEAAKPRKTIIDIHGMNFQLNENQIKSLIFAKNFKRIVEAKNARVVKLSKNQAIMLKTAKHLTEKINNLVKSEILNTRMSDIIEDKLTEKKWIKTNPKEKGKYEGKTLADLKKMREDLKKDDKKYKDQGKKVPQKNREKMAELNFAIRAKEGHGFKESIELDEKWPGKPKVKSLDKWGDYTVAELKKKANALKKKEKRTAAETKQLRQINFAIRAKTGWGKIKEEELDEKWNVKTKTPKAERGKYEGKTQAELKKMLKKIKDSGPHKKNSPEYEKMKELQFALRAKTGWGKVPESIELDEKWPGKPKVKSLDKWGDYTVAELKKKANALKKKEKRTAAETKQLRQINFAIRAKTGWGKIKEEKLDEKKPSAGLTKAERSKIVKKARRGGDIGEKGKNFDKVVKAAKKAGAKNPEAVAAAAMWKNIPR